MKAINYVCLFVGVACLTAIVNGQDAASWKAGAAAIDIEDSYPCPVQVVQFGADLTLVAIGGEATVEYSLRLKRELKSDPAAVWVAGYSNDGFGYLGSKRVIEEGGYEGYSANLRRHPGPWATDTEERVIQKVHELVRSLNHETPF